MDSKPDDLDFDIVLNSERVREKPLIAEQSHKQQQSTSEPKIKSEEGDTHSLTLKNADYDLNKAAHPVICIFTFAFKLAAFFIYFIVGNFISSIITFIIVLTLSSLDFWFTKNISGRLLVGLRWRSSYDSEGKEIWEFESYDEKFISNAADKFFFWSSQVLFTLIWALLLFLKIISLDVLWSLLLIINLGLCFTNLYGFYQCRGDHQKKLKGLKKQYGSKIIRGIAEQIL